VSDLSDELGIHRSLASKFRSGTEFPKVAHLAHLARWSGDPEFLLAAIVNLEVFEPLRRSVATWIARRPLGDLDPPELDTETRDEQVKRRLVDSGLLRDNGAIPDAAIVAVADGHGVRTVAEWLNVHQVSRDGATEWGGLHPPVMGLYVVPASVLADLDPQLPIFRLPSPSWTDIYLSLYGETPSRSLTSIGQRLVDGVPLAVALAAVRAFHNTLVEPTQLWRAESSKEPESAPRPVARLDLTEAQDEQLKLIGDQHVWAVIVDDADAGVVVAERVQRARSATALIGAPSTLAQALTLLAKVEEQKPAVWQSATNLFQNPRPAAEGAPVLVDLGLGGAGDTDLSRATVRRLLERLVPMPGLSAAWYLVGTQEQVQSAAASLEVPVGVITVSRPDPAVPSQPSSTATSDADRVLLPDITWRPPRDVEGVYADCWNLLDQLRTLRINALVQFPPGQGGSAAARAVMSSRYEQDMLEHGGQRLVSLDQTLRTDDAARLLKVHGFADDWARAHDAGVIAAPFLRRSSSLAPAERVQEAEAVSGEVMQPPTLMLRSDADRTHRAIYLDLTATPFGRVPASELSWNTTELLTETYRTIARKVVAAFADRQSVFVFAARDVLDPGMFPQIDWQHLVLDELTREQLGHIRKAHGLPLPTNTPKRLSSSIATWQSVSPPPAQHGSP
jgi:hypothetical protein